MMKYNKRGALELSMTTIIVIVIGVTLLSLGIIWVRNTMEKVTELSDASFATAQQELQERMGSNDAFYVKGNYFKVKRGAIVDITVGAQNILTIQKTFTIDAKSSKVINTNTPIIPDSNIQIITSKTPFILKTNEKAPAIVRVTIPNNIEIGSKPVINLILKDGSNDVGEPKQVTLEVIT